MSTQVGFYVNTDRCIKCYACEVACKQWNGIKAGGVSRRNVYEVSDGVFPDNTRTFISMSCMHCASPACASVCPAGAISKREEDGVVFVNKDKCIGCRYCFFACPFGVPQYDKECMNKCDMCLENGGLEDGGPHCVATCPTKALNFGTMEELSEMKIDKTAKQLANSEVGPSAVIV